MDDETSEMNTPHFLGLTPDLFEFGINENGHGGGGSCSRVNLSPSSLLVSVQAMFCVMV